MKKLKKFIWLIKAYYLLHKPMSKPSKKLIFELKCAKEKLHDQILNDNITRNYTVEAFLLVDNLLNLYNK